MSTATANKKLFLSTVSSEFAPHRNLLAGDLKRPNLDVAVQEDFGVTDGTRWPVPQELYSPIRQDAVLLKRGEKDEASIAFLAFLKGPEARAIIEKFGYGLEGV